MEIKELNHLITNRKILDRKLRFYEEKGIIKKQKSDKLEIEGHL